MGKKVVVINDWTVREKNMMEAFRFLETEFGCELEFVDVQLGYDEDRFQDMFLKMEKGGPDAVESESALIQAMKDADIVISHISAVPTMGVSNAKHLEAVCILRSGVENIDLKNAAAKGVKVINAPGRLAVPVSEFTIGLIIAEMKNIARGDARVKAGNFKRDFPNKGYSVNLKGKNIGLVGCGAVGSRVAKVMDAFEAKVMIFDPYLGAGKIREMGYIPVELNELCEKADVISVHYRLTPETEGLLSKEQFALMKPHCFLINTARAGLVDEEALIDALVHHKIGGAGLDVFHQEPLPEDHPFLTLDNVTVTPHLAGSCSDIFEMTVDIMAGAFRHYFATGEWINVVGK